MIRRTFLTASLASLAATRLLTPNTALANFAAERNGLGLQLWTVRNQLAEDKLKTIKAVAAAGYKQVELMDAIKDVEVAEMAKGEGLEVRSAFFNWEIVANPDNKDLPTVDQVIETAKKVGLEHLVFGYIAKPMRDSADKMKKIADRANAAGEKIKQAGLTMSYHNHSFEFEKLDGGVTGFDIFMERFNEHVKFEVDVFWVAIGGWDPIATLEKLGRRTAQIHLKDLKAGVGTITDEGKVPADAFQEVGDGTINMKKVMEVADRFGIKQFHVEQDQSPDPIASIGQSQKFVTTIW